MTKEFRGVYVANCTAFTDDGRIDETALRKHVRFLLDDGQVHGLIPAGGCGEFAAMSMEERNLVVDITVDETRRKVPVVAGAAAVSTRDTVRLAQHAQEAGADGVMVVAPYYCHPGDDEIYLHYKALSESIDIPIMLYNNPGTSGVDMRPELVERLAGLKHVAYIKESTGDMRRTAEIIQRCGEKIKVFSGADNLALEFFGLGAVGWVCATGNLVPRLCSRMFELAAGDQNWAEARQLYFKALPLLNMLEYGPLVQCLKAGLEILGRPIGHPRPPLQDLPQHQRAVLRDMLTKLAKAT